MKLWEKIKSFFRSLFGGKKEVSTAPVEEEVVKEETPKEIIPFDDADKEAIVNILRPIIKGINSDGLYVAGCEAMLQTKVLKTYATLSEVKKTLTIRLTQSKIFNEQLTEFIADHVVSLFKSSIDAEFLGKYEVTADGGSIVITNVG